MKIEILGVKIDSTSIDEVLEKIKEFISSDNQYFITTPNPEFIVRAKKDNEFKQIINLSDIAVPDGFGLKLAGKLLGQPIGQRITGNDLVWRLAETAEQENYSIFLFGAAPAVAERAAVRLKKIFPSLQVSGAESGGEIKNPKEIIPEIINKINLARPQILLVALGHGKQEKFIYYNLDKFKTVKVAIGVGGAFDYLAGTIKRAPKIMQKSGLEWLYRLIQQPQRLPRIIDAVIIFPWLIIREKFKLNKVKHENS